MPDCNTLNKFIVSAIENRDVAELSLPESTVEVDTKTKKTKTRNTELILNVIATSIVTLEVEPVKNEQRLQSVLKYLDGFLFYDQDKAYIQQT